jgi:EmrB/QacA subfamily drug resistance transporter
MLNLPLGQRDRGGLECHCAASLAVHRSVSMPDSQPLAATDTGAATAAVRLSSGPGRWILLACVLGSGIAGIDGTVANIALPQIGRSLHVGFGSLQWVINSYAFTLAALLLLAGSLGDRYGRCRIFVIGIAWFAVASVLCAAAPSAGLLIAARALQGIGGALMTPASLAILQATFGKDDRVRAIGAWAGLSGTASAIAPFIGGWLLAAGGWRWVFLINPPLAVAVLAIAVLHIPETRDPDVPQRLDLRGAFLGVVGLGGLTAGFIASSEHALGSASVSVPLTAGVVAVALFVVAERREATPMVAPQLFRSGQFSSTNLITLLLYAGNGAALLLLVIELQTVSGFSPLVAGTALLPITVVMLLLAARFGGWAHRRGPRVFMAIGPLVCAAALATLTRLDANSGYWTAVLPAVTVFGVGLALFVAPLTATVLGAVPASHAGIASGVNHSVARAASLLAIAALPVIVGLKGDAYRSGAQFLGPFRAAMWICAGLFAAAAVLAAILIRDGATTRPGTGAGPIALCGDPVLAAHVGRLPDESRGA